MNKNFIVKIFFIKILGFVLEKCKDNEKMINFVYIFYVILLIFLF